MSTNIRAAPPEGLRLVIWTCTLKTLLLVSVTAALPVALVTLINRIVPCIDVTLSVVIAASVTAFLGFFNFLVRLDNVNLQATRPAEHKMDPGLLAAMLGDLRAVADRAGIKNPVHLQPVDGIEQNLAKVLSFVGRKTPIVVFIPTRIAKMTMSREQVKGTFGHEVGHALLYTGFWTDYVIYMILLFGCLLLACPLVSEMFSSVELSTGQHELCLALVAAACLPAYSILRLSQALISRIHEAACDKISDILVAPGLLASSLVKHGKLKGLVQRPSPPVNIIDRWLGKLFGRLLATHPPQHKRIAAGLRPLD